MKFINKLQKFMYGRYGTDDLYKFLLVLYIILFIISLFIRSSILDIIELLIVVIIFYRFFSKNIYQRNKENEKYLKIKARATRPFRNIKRNYKDKEHIYKSCPNCKTTLKLPLPLKRGIKRAKCPSCGKKVTILAFKHQKIKIIRNS